MARLIVEAVSAEKKEPNQLDVLWVYVSVSRADDGTPMTGLSKQNFRVTSPDGSVTDFWVSTVTETRWETADVEPSGCYKLHLLNNDSPSWINGEFYAFGIQVRTLKPEGHEGKLVPVDFGQTVVSVQSFGQ